MSRVRVTAVGEATSLTDRKRRAGQRLMLGFDGPAVTGDVRAVIREIKPAGFVLFGSNVVEPAQVLELTRELASLVPVESPALIAAEWYRPFNPNLISRVMRWTIIGYLFLYTASLGAHHGQVVDFYRNLLLG